MLTQLALHERGRWTNGHSEQEKKHKKWQTQIRLSVIPSPSSKSGPRFAKANHPLALRGQPITGSPGLDVMYQAEIFYGAQESLILVPLKFKDS